MLISEGFKFYCSDKKLLGYSFHTLKSYKIQCNLLIRYLGDMDISELTPIHLKQYLLDVSDPEKRIASGKQPLKPSSIGHRVRFLKSFFRYLHEEGITSKNLSSKLQEPKLGKRIPKAMTLEEIELIRDACNSTKEKAIIEFFFSTGIRIGEARSVNKHDINWETRSLKILGKGDKERYIFFSRKCAIWLKKYLTNREDNCEALFVTQRKPIRRVSVAQLRKYIKDIGKRSETNVNAYPHRWRHSFATKMLSNDAPMDVIMLHLGHVKISTTMLYAQHTPEKLGQLHDKYFR